ncbi:hypothetical protein M7I_1073 [Glarea lozoyensis 74030]|uniref:Uncharacterized protein n=1 Tax=Glarea lozoyensis (strain ATCC 74030 / MF5533) TaxID=1104152 RepID=H0EF35_GLAL7|nr:hypothetical protein M7I_1073 [Glarea lozoyensis 74030]
MKGSIWNTLDQTTLTAATDNTQAAGRVIPEKNLVLSLEYLPAYVPVPSSSTTSRPLDLPPPVRQPLPTITISNLDDTGFASIDAPYLGTARVCSGNYRQIGNRDPSSYSSVSRNTRLQEMRGADLITQDDRLRR